METDYLQALADEVTAMIGPHVTSKIGGSVLIFDGDLEIIESLDRRVYARRASQGKEMMASFDTETAPVSAVGCFVVSLLES